VNIFFDLDGTLLDSRKRLYALFQDLVSESNLTIDEYWELKRNKTNHKTILTERFKYKKDDVDHFEREFLNKIERFDYLQFDIPVYGSYDVLNRLVKTNSLYIVTSRQNKENVFIQLKNLEMYKYFKDILATENKCEKTDLIRILQYQCDDFIIGDTDNDILSGSQLGIHTIAVSYGFLNKQKLGEYNPEFIIDNLIEVIEIIDKNARSSGCH